MPEDEVVQQGERAQEEGIVDQQAAVWPQVAEGGTRETSSGGDAEAAGITDQQDAATNREG